MPRVKGGVTTRKRHKKIKKAVKGFIHSRRASYRRAKEALLKAWSQAFAGRKRKKREMRRLWIVRINAEARKLGFRYSELMALLKQANIKLDRKILAELAFEYPEVFEEVVKTAKKAVKK
ncbi:50S ribosomal protein L20 [bacterium]|nr:50S ribosomal protein L20 [bacterium]